MYDFAVVALLALAVVKTVDFLSDQLNMVRFRSILTFLMSIGVAWLLDYSVFDGVGHPDPRRRRGHGAHRLHHRRHHRAWRAPFGWLTHERATLDETLGEHASLRRAA